jgi:hypothetical protein
MSILVAEKSLNLICMRSLLGSEDDRSPTWVPDWFNFWSDPMALQVSRFPEWKKICFRPPLLNGPDDRTLRTRGFFLDSIDVLSTAFNSHNHAETGLPPADISERVGWRGEWSPKSSFLDDRDNIWRTLCGEERFDEDNDNSNSCLKMPPKLWSTTLTI